MTSDKLRVYFHKIWRMIWCVKLKEIVNLQDIIRSDDLNHKSRRGKTYSGE